MKWLKPEQISGLEALHDKDLFHGKYFLDPTGWVKEMLDRAEYLGVGKKHKLWCLDIGSAVPYFGWVMEQYGHSVLSLDRGTKHYLKSADILNQTFISKEMLPGNVVPPFPYRFDMITMYGVNFCAFSEKEYQEAIRVIVGNLATGAMLAIGNNYGLFNDAWMETRWWKDFLPASEVRILVKDDHKRNVNVQVVKR